MSWRALWLVAAVAVSACGGGNEGGSPSPVDAPAPAPPPLGSEPPAPPPPASPAPSPAPPAPAPAPAPAPPAPAPAPAPAPPDPLDDLPANKRVGGAGATHSTLAAAVNSLQPGDVLEVVGGTHAAQVFSNAGRADAPIVVRGKVDAQGRRPVIQGHHEQHDGAVRRLAPSRAR
jgi:hypothetical protein